MKLQLAHSSRRFALATAVSLLILASLLLPQLVRAQTDTLSFVTSFDYPGALQTFAQGINDAGDIVGYDAESTTGVYRGFVRAADGTFTSVIVPGDDVNGTLATAINNNGVVAGTYTKTPDGAAHGFFYSNGAFTYFDYPGSNQTLINGINDAGDFVGYYYLPDNSAHAFASIGGNLIPITISGSTIVSPTDINNAGDILGWYGTTTTAKGFRLQHDGSLRTQIGPRGYITELFGTNETPASVGSYYDGSIFHGLYFGGGHTYLTFDASGTNYNNLTGINSRGRICGWGGNGSDKAHSYIVSVSRNQ